MVPTDESLIVGGHYETLPQALTFAAVTGTSAGENRLTPERKVPEDSTTRIEILSG